MLKASIHGASPWITVGDRDRKQLNSAVRLLMRKVKSAIVGRVRRGKERFEEKRERRGAQGEATGENNKVCFEGDLKVFPWVEKKKRRKGSCRPLEGNL